MNITVNGQSRLPPGFRFHPTEEELLNYYLRKKIASERIDMDVIHDVDLNKLEPWDIQENCRIGTALQNDWYFFSHKDKKYPTGTRTNRATAAGFWKATGRDKVISTSFRRIGMRKTLVFYKGRAPHGQKSDWIMHEYRLDDFSDANLNSIMSSSTGDATQEEGWVICRVFKKKLHLQTTSDCSNNFSSIRSEIKTQLIMDPSSSDTLDQILQYMGRSSRKQEKENTENLTMRHLNPIESLFNTSTMHERFPKLPPLENPTVASVPTDWATLDSFSACQLNGQSPDTLKQAGGLFDESGLGFGSGIKLISSNGEKPEIDNAVCNGGDGDLWSFTKSCVYSPCMGYIDNLSP